MLAMSLAFLLIFFLILPLYVNILTFSLNSFALGLTINPVAPSFTNSWVPPLFVTIAGNPEAIASNTTFPKASLVEGKTKKSQFA
ncbi:hypothetical protein HYT51_01460 [Candidatus Woesearchaeota archaeon]|nr:hypothetical protein [Candidatus Woesearchaeota archaeon]